MCVPLLTLTHTHTLGLSPVHARPPTCPPTAHCPLPTHARTPALALAPGQTPPSAISPSLLPQQPLTQRRHPPSSRPSITWFSSSRPACSLETGFATGPDRPLITYQHRFCLLPRRGFCSSPAFESSLPNAFTLNPLPTSPGTRQPRLFDCITARALSLLSHTQGLSSLQVQLDIVCAQPAPSMPSAHATRHH